MYECRFGSFFYLHVTREKLPKQRSYKKFVHLTLMKLTAGVNFINVLSWSFYVHRSQKHKKQSSCQSLIHSQDLHAKKLFIKCWRNRPLDTETVDLWHALSIWISCPWPIHLVYSHANGLLLHSNSMIDIAIHDIIHKRVWSKHRNFTSFLS